MTDAQISVGLLVAFFALFYWLFRKPETSDMDARPDYTFGARDMGYAGKYLRRHKPIDNTNKIINNIFGAPRAFLLPYAVIVQEVMFPDGSFYQGQINFAVMREKTDAAIFRAGQHTWIDSQFKTNWSEAKRVGMRRGCYWFYDDRVSPGEQAEILVSLIRDDLPEMEVFIDYETTYGGGFDGLSQVCAMMGAVERALPTVTVGLYTGYYFFREHSNPVTNVLQYAYLKSRPLWLAWYSADASSVLIPAPWTKIMHWQFGTPAVGEDWGVQTLELDMNYFNGTETEFALRYGGVLPGEPGPGETMDRFRVTWPKGANKRPAPNVNNTPVGVIAYGAEFDVMGFFVPDGKTAAQEQWGRLADGYWVALVYNSQVRAVAVQVTEPPPPADIEPPDYILAHWIATNKTTKYIPE